MATATAVLNEKYKSKDGTYQIIIRLIDGKKQRTHAIGHRVKLHHWENGQVKESHPDSDIINSVIDDELVKAKRYFRDCRLQNVPIDLELVFKEVRSHLFTDYLRHRADQHKEADQIEMYYKCMRFVKEFVACFGRDVYFSELTQDNLREYDAWLQKETDEKKKNVANTRKKKFEFLGKYWNNAHDDKKVTGENPFEKYSIKGTPTKKEKLTLVQIKAIEDLPLKDGFTALARDLFLFSYYCKGARFETCITAPKSSIKNGRLYLQTNKGKKFISILVHPKLQTIIDRYIDNDTDTIFGRVDSSQIKTAVSKRSKIGSENYMVNRALKDVAALAEIPIALSMHLARHSLAFHLKQVTNNMHIISQALGHSRAQITEVYLKELDDEAVDVEVNKIYGNG